MELEAGEHVIFQGHPSWRATIGFYVKGVLAVAIVGALTGGGTRLAGDAVDGVLVTLVVVGLLVALLAAGYLLRISTTYTITSQRLHIRRGILARAEQQTLISRVQNVNTHQSVLQRALLVGDVDFDTAAGDDYEFRFSGVARPGEVVESVHRAQREADAATLRSSA